MYANPRASQCTENNLPSLRRAGMLLFLQFRPDIMRFTFLLYSRRSKSKYFFCERHRKNNRLSNLVNIHAGISGESDRFERDALGLIQSRCWLTKDHVILR